MIIIGLTGGFGTGKSFVATQFKGLGARVIDADKIGHRLFKKDSATYKRIVAAFGGKKILRGDLLIDRAALAAIVKVIPPNSTSFDPSVDLGIVA
jgi:Dephospho-CoA kinase